jgi:hypothetical protein
MVLYGEIGLGLEMNSCKVKGWERDLFVCVKERSDGD